MLSITQIFRGNFKFLTKKKFCIFYKFFQLLKTEIVEDQKDDLVFYNFQFKLMYMILLIEEQKIYFRLSGKYDDRALDFYRLYSYYWDAINVLRKIYLKEYYFEEIFELKNDMKFYFLLVKNELFEKNINFHRLFFFIKLEKLIEKIDIQEGVMKHRNKEFGQFDEDGNDRDQMEIDLANPFVRFIVDEMIDAIHPCHTLSEEDLEYLVDMDPTNYLEIPYSKLKQVKEIKKKRKKILYRKIKKEVQIIKLYIKRKLKRKLKIEILKFLKSK
jgi:hypothetical protein